MSNITKKAFPVLNMHCAGCANNVENSEETYRCGRRIGQLRHKHTVRFVRSEQADPRRDPCGCTCRRL